MTVPVSRGTVVWVDLSPTIGQEQHGRRPAVIMASDGYLANVPNLAVVVPVTTRDRGWPHHVHLTGPDLRLERPSFAMTEQPRTVSRARITAAAGSIDAESIGRIVGWLRDFLDI